MAYQLCLPIGDTSYSHNGRSYRPIPPVVKELLELSENSPSGLVWRVNSRNGRARAGSPAGSLMKGRDYYLVGIKNHGVFYAHRIAYYLKYGQDPGSMVVRHTDTGNLIVGCQDDNQHDERGKTKKNKKDNSTNGSVTSRMYLYQGIRYNLKSLCDHLGLKYGRMYSRIHVSKVDPVKAFEQENIKNVVPMFK